MRWLAHLAHLAPGGRGRFATIAALTGVSLWQQRGVAAIAFTANPPPGGGVLRLGQTGGHPAEAARHRAALAAGQPFHDVHYRYRDATGAARHMLLSGIPRHGTGRKITGYRGTARDITPDIAARDQAARALRDAQAASTAAAQAARHADQRIAEAERARSEFLAAISHELRTPLHAIIGFAELIRDQPFGPIAAPYAGYARDIHASGKRLLDQVNDLLELSRIEAGQYRLNEEPVLIEALLGGCLAQIRPRAQEAKLRVTPLAVPAGIAARAMVRADRHALRHVVLNLLDNAIKFTPPGGQVALGFTIEADGAAVLSVRDTGIGIEAAALRDLGTPFTQLDSAADRRFQGLGLGLSLCRRLMSLHGGTLSLDSTAGEGTHVRAHLPAERLLPASPIAKAPAIPASTRESATAEPPLIQVRAAIA